MPSRTIDDPPSRDLLQERLPNADMWLAVLEILQVVRGAFTQPFSGPLLIHSHNRLSRDGGLPHLVLRAPNSILDTISPPSELMFQLKLETDKDDGTETLQVKTFGFGDVDSSFLLRYSPMGDEGFDVSLQKGSALDFSEMADMVETLRGLLTLRAMGDVTSSLEQAFDRLDVVSTRDHQALLALVPKMRQWLVVLRDRLRQQEEGATGEDVGAVEREPVRAQEGLNGMAEERDRAVAERDRVQGQHDRVVADLTKAKGERDRAVAERDRVQGQHDRVVADLTKAKGERDRAVAERDRVQGQHDRVVADLTKAKGERDRAVAERDRVQGQHDRVVADLTKAKGERDRAVAERDGVQAELTEKNKQITSLERQVRRLRRLEQSEPSGQDRDSARAAADAQKIKNLEREIQKLKSELQSAKKVAAATSKQAPDHSPPPTSLPSRRGQMRGIALTALIAAVGSIRYTDLGDTWPIHLTARGRGQHALYEQGIPSNVWLRNGSTAPVSSILGNDLEEEDLWVSGIWSTDSNDPSFPRWTIYDPGCTLDDHFLPNGAFDYSDYKRPIKSFSRYVAMEGYEPDNDKRYNLVQLQPVDWLEDNDYDGLNIPTGPGTLFPNFGPNNRIEGLTVAVGTWGCPLVWGDLSIRAVDHGDSVITANELGRGMWIDLNILNDVRFLNARVYPFRSTDGDCITRFIDGNEWKQGVWLEDFVDAVNSNNP